MSELGHSVPYRLFKLKAAVVSPSLRSKAWRGPSSTRLVSGEGPTRTWTAVTRRIRFRHTPLLPLSVRQVTLEKRRGDTLSAHLETSVCSTPMHLTWEVGKWEQPRVVKRAERLLRKRHGGHRPSEVHCCGRRRREGDGASLKLESETGDGGINTFPKTQLGSSLRFSDFLGNTRNVPGTTARAAATPPAGTGSAITCGGEGQGQGVLDRGRPGARRLIPCPPPRCTAAPPQAAPREVPTPAPGPRVAVTFVQVTVGDEKAPTGVRLTRHAG